MNTNTPTPSNTPVAPTTTFAPSTRRTYDKALNYTLTVVSANCLNLARAHRMFYANQDPYSEAEFERKAAWLGQRIGVLNADVLACQEVWDASALKSAVAKSGQRYQVIAPLAQDTDDAGNKLSEPCGAQGTPALALVTRLEVEAVKTFAQFAADQTVPVPDLPDHVKFERAPLLATLRTKQGLRFHVLNTHMKSKRPKFLQDAQGNPTEDREDPKVLARAVLRSLVIRAAEAVALRSIVVDVLKGTHEPLIVMGDFNDSTHSVTTQIVAATNEVAYDRAARDFALFDAFDLQGERALKKDVAYSHIHQGQPDVLDQIFVSEEFVSHGKFSVGDVRRVDYFNDHLAEGKDRSKSDHGFVRAVLRVYG